MGKYKNFGVKLLDAFKTDLSILRKAYEKYSEIEARPTLGVSPAYVARRAADLADAAEELSAAAKWSGFYSTAADVRARFEEAITEAQTLRPDMVDMAAVKLLESGMMTPEDFARMHTQYADNFTMQRLIIKHMEAARDAAGTSKERDQVERRSKLELMCQDARAQFDAPERRFKDFVSALDRCTGKTNGTIGKISGVGYNLELTARVIDALESSADNL